MRGRKRDGARVKAGRRLLMRRSKQAISPEDPRFHGDEIEARRKAAGYSRTVRRACAPPPGRYYSDGTSEIRDVVTAYVAADDAGNSDVEPGKTVLVVYDVHVPGSTAKPERWELPLRTWLREGWQEGRS